MPDLDDPVPENFGGRGRPPHIATQDNRDKVTLLLALGWSNERIARALSITPPTLRKNYRPQLKLRDDARDRLDAAYAMRIWTAVQEGNVGAMRLWAQFMDRNDRMVGHESFYSEQRREVEAETVAEAKPEALGKKALAAKAAETAGIGTEWADDLKPH